MKTASIQRIGALLGIFAAINFVPSATAGDQVPIKGSFATICSVVPPPSGAAAAVIVDGIGTLAQLGLCTNLTESPVLWYLVMDPTYFYPVGMSTKDCVITFTAANGDKLVASMSATVTNFAVLMDPVKNPEGRITFEGTSTIVGGTGRFAGATGTPNFKGGAYPWYGDKNGNAIGWFDVDGVISSVGANKQASSK